MVTDEERREVAAMLLKVMLEVRPGDEYSAIRRCIYTPEADRHCFGHANRTHWAFGRLAELIEPDPERTCVVEHWGGGVFYLSCGVRSHRARQTRLLPDMRSKGDERLTGRNVLLWLSVGVCRKTAKRVFRGGWLSKAIFADQAAKPCRCEQVAR